MTHTHKIHHLRLKLLCIVVMSAANSRNDVPNNLTEFYFSFFFGTASFNANIEFRGLSSFLRSVSLICVLLCFVEINAGTRNAKSQRILNELN